MGTIDSQIRDAIAVAIAPLRKEVRDLCNRLDPPKEWLTISEAAKQLGVHESTVRRKIAGGEIETNGMSGKARRVRL
jgi:excisionase family DNA binding protein